MGHSNIRSMSMSMSPDSFANEHDAFAASRVSQYVYVPTNPLFFSTIDTFVDANEGDVKKPLVVLGEEGSGKSALIANWTAKRKENRTRQGDFVFQHVVGCSTPSLQLAHTLFRLETALKHHFQLREMKIPDNEEDLRWALNRFLSAAAKKLDGGINTGTIIIVIDGVHLIKSSCGPDGVLYWLPTSLPPGVRIILSTIEFSKIKASVNTMKNASHTHLHEPHDPIKDMIDSANRKELNKTEQDYMITDPRFHPEIGKEEREETKGGDTDTAEEAGPKKNPTLVELERRECSFLTMEPLVSIAETEREKYICMYVCMYVCIYTHTAPQFYVHFFVIFPFHVPYLLFIYYIMHLLRTSFFFRSRISLAQSFASS